MLVIYLGSARIAIYKLIHKLNKMFTISRAETFDRIKFTKWLRSTAWFTNQEKTVKEALQLADKISNGEELVIWLADNHEWSTGSQVCKLTEIELEDPFVEQRKRQAELISLRDRGAAGDAAAAIAYCKSFVIGLPPHGGFI